MVTLKISDSLVMFFTSFSRNSSDINKTFIKKIINTNGLMELQNLSYEAMNIFKNDKIDIKKLGFYLNSLGRLKAN